MLMIARLSGDVPVIRRTIISRKSLVSERGTDGLGRDNRSMYANYWGLREIPFQNTLDGRWFYESPAHEEALARLLYLVEQHRRCGVLWGPAGTGKSLVLELLRREAVRTGAEVALVDLLGSSGREMLWEVLAALGLSPAVNESQMNLWRRLHDHVLASRYAHASLVLIFDHLDRAHADCVALIERLQHLSSGGNSGLTLVLGVAGDRAAGIWQTLREVSDLRIDLPPLDCNETQRYVEFLLLRAGADRPVFDRSAFDRLFDETHGIPRDLNRLCDLALLAGMADQAVHIDAAIVSAAAEELHARPRNDRPLVHFRERFAAEI
jgi:general secretion pathway protein A